MSEKSNIEWTHSTANFWWGCNKVSEACANCYAETMDRMRGPLFDDGRVHWGLNAPRWLKTDSATEEVRKLNRKAAKMGRRFRVFVNSMSDTFEDHAQLPAAREILFNEIETLTHLDFQLLTKRPQNIERMVPVHWMQDWPEHVHIGTTVELQKWADERIPHLLSIPAKVRFLSCEPLLGPVDIAWALPHDKANKQIVAAIQNPALRELAEGLLKDGGQDISWVICGGESGPGKRPMDLAWARSLRDQCDSAGTPFFMKQIDKVQPIPADLMIRQFPV